MRNWPPAWTRIRGEDDHRPKGEVGVLREVRWPPIQLRPFDRFFMVMEFERSFYMGCLLFEDPAFCIQIDRLLRARCGSSIESIGSLDVSYTL
ncbi:MAG TPA: hypothetical protein VGH16_08265 [Candidatus Binatia bacterium]